MHRYLGVKTKIERAKGRKCIYVHFGILCSWTSYSMHTCLSINTNIERVKERKRICVHFCTLCNWIFYSMHTCLSIKTTIGTVMRKTCICVHTGMLCNWIPLIAKIHVWAFKSRWNELKKNIFMYELELCAVEYLIACIPIHIS